MSNLSKISRVFVAFLVVPHTCQIFSYFFLLFLNFRKLQFGFVVFVPQTCHTCQIFGFVVFVPQTCQIFGDLLLNFRNLFFLNTRPTNKRRSRPSYQIPSTIIPKYVYERACICQLSQLFVVILTQKQITAFK